MKINYDSVRRDAKKLKALAEDCETAAQTCSKYKNELNQYWQGAAADSYVGGLAQLNKKNKALANQIQELAAQITAVANELEEEDRRLAAQIAARKVSDLAKNVTSATGTVSKTNTVSTVRKAADTISKAGGTTKKTADAVGKVGSAVTSAVSKTGTKTTAGLVSDLVSRLFGKG